MIEVHDWLEQTRELLLQEGRSLRRSRAELVGDVLGVSDDIQAERKTERRAPEHVSWCEAARKLLEEPAVADLRDQGIDDRFLDGLIARREVGAQRGFLEHEVLGREVGTVLRRLGAPPLVKRSGLLGEPKPDIVRVKSLQIRSFRAVMVPVVIK